MGVSLFRGPSVVSFKGTPTGKIIILERPTPNKKKISLPANMEVHRPL